ncbi:unnamed protein product [Candidula unifasciata]|uniref:Flavin-containing monooxygenase n=1 Tax=Candidula unifasciata TaxID=100452 RepID=A0A8S4A8P7_9EUPU|nr:unnamed protein product [Candidula unifasciata]
MATNQKDAIVIGAGISGLVTAKTLKEDNFAVTIIERSSDIGGLWTFRENDYGVMSFTHINVSKYNYAFSDFPFPESVPDYPHHSDMAKYIKDYASHFALNELVHFNLRVVGIEQEGEKWKVICNKVKEDGQTSAEGTVVYTCSYLAITTGHHAKPNWPKFKGEELFSGKIIHSVDYKDAVYNDFTGKRVLVVGIGNSAVDAAVDCATAGRCPSVYISSRSGAWVVPNYVLGVPTDLYACRFFLYLPKSVTNFVFGALISLVQGSPWKWGLNPKMKALETQPTVSPTLIHHIQRGNIKIKPDIKEIKDSTVHFVDGSTADVDRIIYCTGYKIDLPFLPKSVKEQVTVGESNEMQLYRNVFLPEIGASLAFIGFVQPASGGLLTMSEIQARWFSELCKGKIRLPSKPDMNADIKDKRELSQRRWYKSARHTIQQDPIIYTDEIASVIGAKPDLLKNPSLAWRLMFSSCGVSQWRLNGPHKWSQAAQQVRKVPIPPLWNITGYALVLIILGLLYKIIIYLVYLF